MNGPLLITADTPRSDAISSFYGKRGSAQKGYFLLDPGHKDCWPGSGQIEDRPYRDLQDLILPTFRRR
jgi:hypothetical protein